MQLSLETRFSTLNLPEYFFDVVVSGRHVKSIMYSLTNDLSLSQTYVAQIEFRYKVELIWLAPSRLFRSRSTL